MQNRSTLSLFDRIAIGLLCGVFGLVVSAIVWAVVAFATSNPAGHVAPFVFAAVTFAISGFLLGSSFADVLGILFQSVWIAANAWIVNPDAETDLGEKPFRPIWALVFFLPLSRLPLGCRYLDLVVPHANISLQPTFSRYVKCRPPSSSVMPLQQHLRDRKCSRTKKDRAIAARSWGTRHEEEGRVCVARFLLGGTLTWWLSWQPWARRRGLRCRLRTARDPGRS